MGRALAGIASVIALGSGLVACGDPLLCKSDVFVALQTTDITTDFDTAPGVQGDLRIRTSLTEGEIVEITILDADGHVSSTSSAAVDALGNATIRATFPLPRVTVRARAVSLCGEGRDEVTIDVLPGIGCELALDPPPQVNEFYAPLGVLPWSADANLDEPGFQATVKVATRADWVVDLFVTSSVGEVPMGSAPALGGIAALAVTLPEGQIGVRAVCHGRREGSEQAASLVSSAIVDSVQPTCDLTDPAPGMTITPALDLDHNTANGLQLAVAMHIAGADVDGETFDLAVTPTGGSSTMVAGIVAGNVGMVNVTLAPPTNPATFEFVLSGHDRAGNTCTATHEYEVELEGCDIAITSPTTTVTADADGLAANGAQVDVGVRVAAACVGQTVTSSCGGSSPSAVVPASGTVVLRAHVCATSPCEVQTACTVEVSTAAGVQTSASTTIAFDNLGPAVLVEVIQSPLACGSQITSASDANPNVAGVQIATRVTAAGVVTARRLELMTTSGATTFNASNDVVITLASGLNRLIGIATDELGNIGRSATCALTLE
ncbi:MAG: hypothetical protein H0T79_03955 [Deltaproteobacteria bacterium]|nr:hypothetical protein [Deltaproteobacteria bacterium]